MRLHPRFSVLSVAAVLAGCAATPVLQETWRDPGRPARPPQRLLVLAISSEESFRRVAEDELVRHLPAGLAQASWEVLPAAAALEPAQVREEARARGIDGALVLRVLDVDKTVQYVPGAYTPWSLRFSDCGRQGAFYFPTRFDRGFEYTERTYNLETSLYQLGDDKLVWSGRSRVRDPGTVRELVAEVAEAVAVELHQQGFLP